MQSPRVSIIVPYYGSDIEALLRCLDAIGEQTYPPDNLELIVVDNNPQTALSSNSHFKGTKIVLLHQPKPGSYAARNLGIGAVTGEVIAFTDADCVPAPDWVREGVSALQANEGCGLAAGAIEPIFQDPCAPNACELFDGCVHLRQKEYAETLHFGATANVFTYRRVLDEVGLFDEALLSGGDREWGIRVWQRGFTVAYAPASIVRHTARGSLAEHLSKARRLVGQGYVFARRKKTLVALRMLRIEVNMARQWLSLIRNRKEALGASYGEVMSVCRRVIAERFVEVFRLSLTGRMER